MFRTNVCIFTFADIENPQCSWESDQSIRKGGKFSNVRNKNLIHYGDNSVKSVPRGTDNMSCTCRCSCHLYLILWPGQMVLRLFYFPEVGLCHEAEQAKLLHTSPSVSLLSLSPTVQKCSCCQMQEPTSSQTAAALQPQVHHEVSWSAHSQQGCAGSAHTGHLCSHRDNSLLPAPSC